VRKLIIFNDLIKRDGGFIVLVCLVVVRESGQVGSFLAEGAEADKGASVCERGRLKGLGIETEHFIVPAS